MLRKFIKLILNESNQNQVLFVYGTLRKNEENHNMLKNSKFLGKAIAKDLKKFFANNSVEYAIVPQKNKSVHGELYSVPNDVLKKIDKYEQPEFKRKKIDLEDGREVFAYLFVE